MIETAQRLADDWPVQHLIGKGQNFTYREAGSQHQGAFPIILLHGIGSGSGSWLYQFSALSNQVRMIAWDAPGYGGSDPLKNDWPQAKDYARALATFTECLGLEQFHLVGHSLGALMAASFAIHFPEKVVKLLLLDPAAGYGDAEAKEREKKLNQRLTLMERLGPRGMAEQRSPNLLTPGATEELQAFVKWNMAQLDPLGHCQAARMLANGTLFKDVAQIKCPIEVMWGAHDIITPPDKCKKVATAAGVEGREIAMAGHASYIENANDFNQYLMSYLSDQHDNE